MKQISLICFRVYLEVYVVKNPTCFSRWSVRYLKKAGFDEEYSRPDIKNTKFLVWVFKDSDALEAKVKEYYDYVNSIIKK